MGLLLGCSSGEATGALPGSGTTGTLQGQVTRGAATGNAGSLVWVAGTSLVGVTEDDGSYVIGSVPPGTAYTVMATASGYTVAQEASIAVTAGASTTVPPMTLARSDNHSPQVATLTCDPLRLQAGGTCSLDVTASDDDGDALTYAWTAAAGSLSATTGTSVDWTAPATDGSYLVTVVVSDGNGGAASGGFAVLVATDHTNSNPTITAMSPATGSDYAKGEAVTVSVTAADADGDPLTYSWSTTGGSFSGSGNSVTWTAPPASGIYTITCTVEDGAGGSAVSSVTVTVSATNIIVW